MTMGYESHMMGYWARFLLMSRD